MQVDPGFDPSVLNASFEERGARGYLAKVSPAASASISTASQQSSCRDASRIENACGLFINSRYVNLSAGPSTALSADDSALEVHTRFDGS